LGGTIFWVSTFFAFVLHNICNVDRKSHFGPQQFLAIECKTAAQIEPSALKGFAEIEKSYGAVALKKAAIVCRTESPYPLAPRSRIVALPLVGAGGLVEWLS
jgi:hypothetical protein